MTLHICPSLRCVLWFVWEEQVCFQVIGIIEIPDRTHQGWLYVENRTGTWLRAGTYLALRFYRTKVQSCLDNSLMREGRKCRSSQTVMSCLWEDPGAEAIAPSGSQRGGPGGGAAGPGFTSEDDRWCFVAPLCEGLAVPSGDGRSDIHTHYWQTY